MPRKAKPRFKSSDLSKGQLRKLNALRKSLGDEIANRAFDEWLSHQPDATESSDRNAATIAEALTKLAMAGKFRIPRGGYILRRGRGRVIVELPK
ncbi:MAG TPA: hypothetical protein VEU47_19600 [Candidatus Cybelea sp.]|nr:hypothetical protein [Candidatus Cybelea sp.]